MSGGKVAYNRLFASGPGCCFTHITANITRRQ